MWIVEFPSSNTHELTIKPLPFYVTDNSGFSCFFIKTVIMMFSRFILLKTISWKLNRRNYKNQSKPFIPKIST